MTKIFIVTAALLATSKLWAAPACGSIEENVKAVITDVYVDDSGVFCYARDLNSKKRYDVMDCGTLQAGEVVLGRVYTHWLGDRDANGEKICHYQSFVPYKLPR